MTNNYQDLWLKGRCESRGDRECEKRYELIRQFCAQFHRPFTMLDIGCSLCYFGVRLTEDFPDCTVIGIECDHAPEALDVLRRNEAQRVILLTKRVSLDDLRRIAECETFDLVLALSVIHRWSEPWKERLEVFRSLGDHLILEIPVESCTGGNVEWQEPEGARLLGHGDSHLEAGAKRPIYLLSRMKTGLAKAYLGSPREDLSLAIYSDFNLKQVQFYNKAEARPWLRGLNLRTYDQMGGRWPEREVIARQLEAHGYPMPHLDIKPWNVILQGDDSVLIDAADKNMNERYPDAEYFHRLIRWLKGDQIEWPM